MTAIAVRRVPMQREGPALGLEELAAQSRGERLRRVVDRGGRVGFVAAIAHALSSSM
jgi:hypothetical protein